MEDKKDLISEESTPEIVEKTESFDVFFQFGENHPIKFATTYDGNHFSLVLNADKHECPEVNFTDGNGNHFKFYMKRCT